MEKAAAAASLPRLKVVHHKPSKKPRSSALKIKNTITVKVAWRQYRLKDMFITRLIYAKYSRLIITKK
jgi:hypothetical protein